PLLASKAIELIKQGRLREADHLIQEAKQEYQHASASGGPDEHDISDAQENILNAHFWLLDKRAQFSDLRRLASKARDDAAHRNNAFLVWLASSALFIALMNAEAYGAANLVYDSARNARSNRHATDGTGLNNRAYSWIQIGVPSRAWADAEAAEHLF